MNTAVPHRLLPQHLTDLRRSALSDATIAAAGFYSETDPQRIAGILNWDRPATSLGPCLVIPFRNLDGSLDTFSRVKPDRPRWKDGKPVKYEQPQGKSPKAYFTWQAIEAARTPGAMLAITEGEKKSLAVSQAGCPCIGLCGIWSWPKPKKDTPEDSDRQLIADLAGIAWAGRIVLIIFDTDSRRNPDVNHAAAELARVLCNLGARP